MLFYNLIAPVFGSTSNCYTGVSPSKILRHNQKPKEVLGIIIFAHSISYWWYHSMFDHPKWEFWLKASVYWNFELIKNQFPSHFNRRGCETGKAGLSLCIIWHLHWSIVNTFYLTRYETILTINLCDINKRFCQYTEYTM